MYAEIMVRRHLLQFSEEIVKCEMCSSNRPRRPGIGEVAWRRRNNGRALLEVWADSSHDGLGPNTKKHFLRQGRIRNNYTYFPITSSLGSSLFLVPKKCVISSSSSLLYFHVCVLNKFHLCRHHCKPHSSDDSGEL